MKGVRHTYSTRVTTTSWLLVAMQILLPIALHASSGIIICFESDGRFEIESGRYGDCAKNVNGVADEVHEQFVPEGSTAILASCNPACLDILVLASSSEAQAWIPLDSTRQPILASRSVTTTLFCVDRPVSHTMKTGQPTSGNHFPTHVLRSVVLLI